MRPRPFRRTLHALAACLLAASYSFASTAELQRAKELFNRTEYKAALRVLETIKGPADGSIQELTGKTHYMLGDYKKASEAFERATDVQPKNSAYFHWLGRAYGRRAETSSVFTAPGLASKARQAFEKAVALDARNIEAANDLFTYYLEAPGFLGGGVDKAEALAKKIQALDQVEYHYAMAKLSEKRKQFDSAAHHLHKAMELAPGKVGRIIDLAKFLAKQGRVQESDALFAQAEKLAPNTPRLLFERANSYIHAGNKAAARPLLQRYLKAPLTPDDPPRAEAERLLKQTGV